jgi:hypothetical protein
MTGTNCDLFTHKQSRSYMNHLVLYLYLSVPNHRFCLNLTSKIFKFFIDSMFVVTTQNVVFIFLISLPMTFHTSRESGSLVVALNIKLKTYSHGHFLVNLHSKTSSLVTFVYLLKICCHTVSGAKTNCHSCLTISQMCPIFILILRQKYGVNTFSTGKVLVWKLMKTGQPFTNFSGWRRNHWENLPIYFVFMEENVLKN